MGLDLGGSQITDAGLQQLNPPRLQWLSIRDTGVTGTGIQSWLPLSSVSGLILDGRQFTPEVAQVSDCRHSRSACMATTLTQAHLELLSGIPFTEGSGPVRDADHAQYCRKVGRRTSSMENADDCAGWLDCPIAAGIPAPAAGWRHESVTAAFARTTDVAARRPRRWRRWLRRMAIAVLVLFLVGASGFVISPRWRLIADIWLSGGMYVKTTWSPSIRGYCCAGRGKTAY